VTYEKTQYWERLHLEHSDSLSAVGYSEMGRGFNEATYGLRLAAAEEILRRAGCSPHTVLETAVGVGAYARLWKKLGVDGWVGVDLAQTAVEHLRARFPEATFFQADIAACDDGLHTALAGRRFDLVTAIDVLYHIVDEAEFSRALSALAESVTPDGFLLLTDVFVDSPRRIAAHVLRRPLERYEELLAEVGLVLVEREPIFAILGDPVRRSAFHAIDLGMYLVWRVLSKIVRIVPFGLRDWVGRVSARLLTPLDSLLKRAGHARGTNLELALFRKSKAHAREPLPLSLCNRPANGSLGL